MSSVPAGMVSHKAFARISAAVRQVEQAGLDRPWKKRETILLDDPGVSEFYDWKAWLWKDPEDSIWKIRLGDRKMMSTGGLFPYGTLAGRLIVRNGETSNVGLFDWQPVSAGTWKLKILINPLPWNVVVYFVPPTDTSQSDLESSPAWLVLPVATVTGNAEAGYEIASQHILGAINMTRHVFFQYIENYVKTERQFLTHKPDGTLRWETEYVCDP